MADYLDQLFDALRERIVTVWPEVLKGNGGSGIWHGIEIATIPWDKFASKLPVVLLDVNVRASSEWGLGNRVDAGDVNIYYVTTNEGMVPHLSQKLYELRQNLYQNDVLTTGQVVAYPSVSWSMELAPNRYFLGNQKPFYAGAVTVPVVVGELAEE